jgi:hypothetical protein
MCELRFLQALVQLDRESAAEEPALLSTKSSSQEFLIFLNALQLGYFVSTGRFTILVLLASGAHTAPYTGVKDNQVHVQPFL